VVSKVTLYAAETTDGPQQARPVESLPSPGVGIRHYAPRARVVVVEMAEKDSAERDHVWVQAVALTQKNGQRCGILLPEHWPLPDGFSGPRYAWGDWSDPASLAHGLYSGLRALDAQGVSVIVCPLPAPVGMGATVRDRILKAARSEETGPGITA
jgi:L-threonylcarbamoyladenylate synthase